MVRDIPKGTTFKSMYKSDIVVEKKLGEGGQGQVYLVRYNGEHKAMKVYKPGALREPKLFYKNLVNNVKRKSPDDRFLWPMDILPWNGKSCGYIMDLRPKEYCELVDFMNSKKPDIHFSSYRAAVTAAMEMCSAFRILHKNGYSYQDLSGGNFFVRPDNGRVLICDNDNVSEYGKNSGILGTPGYMAPEVVRGEAKPSTNTDRFSLAVVIFILITMSHPLEGRRHLVPAMTEKAEKALYGTEPIFILDPKDERNRPVRGIHNNIGMIWPELPSYVREMFTRQFSQEVMMNPNLRATEQQWQEMLARFRSDILYCPYHKAESFGYDPAKPVCSNCGHPLNVSHYLTASGVSYPIPLVPGTIIYRCQLGTASVDTAGDPVFCIRSHPKDPKTLVIQNVSGMDVTFSRPGTARQLVAANKVVAATPGTCIELQSGSIEVV